MAISTGSFFQKREKEKEAKKIASQVARERKKEGGLGGLLSLLSIPLAFATGGISNLIMGKGATGLLASLGKAAIGGGVKHVAESGLRSRGMGGDPSKIRSDSKYGFGRQEAEDYRSSMQEGIRERSPFTVESLLTSTLLDQLPTFGTEGFNEVGDITQKTKDFKFSDLWSKDTLYKQGKGGLFGTKDIVDKFNPFTDANEPFSDMEQGGLVPSDNKSQTISDYFSMQGKSLGGSNKKSLAEMLGRK